MEKEMKYLYKIALMIIMVLLTGCSGSTSPDIDDSPAFKIDIFEHSGDTGDIIKNNYGVIIDTLNCYYGSDSTFYEMENTGIDAYHEGDWIYVPWQHISDPTTVSLEIFRFSYSDYQNSSGDFIQSIDYIPFSTFNDDHYLDTFSNTAEDPVNKTWFYFIKTTNAAGNTAYSDTVGYHLVDKPLLQAPYDGESFTISDTVSFRWELNSSVSSIKYRLVVFDENYHLIWHYNLLSDEEPEIEYSEMNDAEPQPGLYIWRVDAIIERIDDLSIYGKMISISSGAEALERRFYIN